MNVFEQIKHKFSYAGIVEKIIYINLAIFVVMFFANTLSFLFKAESHFLMNWFALSGDFKVFIVKPWTIISYGFLHAGFIHILGNLIALYFIGNLFIQYFTTKLFVYFYLLGTFVGGVLFLLSYTFFPVFKDVNFTSLVGASAGVSAIFIGIATYIPNYEIKIPLIGFVKLWILAVIWVSLDVIQIPASNAGGHIAHLGGALFGFLYVRVAKNKEINPFEEIKKRFVKKKKNKMKTVYKSAQKNTSKATNQEKIDVILDKISKSGYDALTKQEKEFLFKQGN